MTHQLTVEPLGESVSVEEGQTLLDACLRAGIWLPYCCNHGLCGTCKLTLLEGEIDHNEASPFALTEMERDEDKLLACVATLRGDAVVEADIEEEEDALHLPVRDWRARVAERVDLTPTIAGLYLEPEAPGFTFQAGQYLNLRVPGEATPRAFSMANAPGAGGAIELHVRRVEGGRATTYIHDQLAVGDQVAFTAPLGRFFVRKSISDATLFLAGGSGLSSPKAMILDLLADGEEREITLIHGVRDAAELYFQDLFRDLEARHANFHYVPALSAADPADGSVDTTGGGWQGERGFVHEVAERRFAGRFAGHTAYLCGPPPMIDACLTTLMRGRLFEERIFTESFYTAADAARPPRRSALFRKF